MTITIPIDDYEPVVIEEPGPTECVVLTVPGGRVALNDYEREQLIAALKAVRPKSCGTPALPVA